MLVEFKVTNFRSIRNTQTLSMVASPGKELLDKNTCISDFDINTRLVSSAVIYGPNAAGKSNLTIAIAFMRWLILKSTKEIQKGDEIPVDNFIFDAEHKKNPSEFEMIFSKNGIRYQYGFVTNKKNIIEEWLYAYPHERPQKWFSREFNTSNNTYSWKFSKFLKGSNAEKKLWKNSTRNNALFLSTAVQLNNEQLGLIFEWFQKNLVTLTSHVKSISNLDLDKTINRIKTPEGKQEVMKYMNIADPSITGIFLEVKKVSEDETYKKIAEELNNAFKEKLIDTDIEKISFAHVNNAVLDQSQESYGTRKFLGFAGYWIDALENGQAVVVDELDTSVHPLAVKFLISLFCNPNINKKNAQLVFSTHNTALLDNDLFRRDQVWFVEKDKYHSTQLYPLLDFSPRPGEAIEKGYLQGRYGALPYIGEWKF